MGIVTHTTTYRLRDANEAVAEIRAGRFEHSHRSRTHVAPPALKTAKARQTNRSQGLSSANSPGAEGLDGARHATQFRQPLEPPDAGVARVDLLANVAQRCSYCLRGRRVRARSPRQWWLILLGSAFL